MNSVELFVFNYMATGAFVFGFFTVCGLCLVPAMCKSYLQWQKTQKQKDFMGWLIQLILSLLLLTNAYPIFVSGIIQISAMPIVSSGILRFMLSGVPIIAFWFFSSKAYSSFQKVKLHKSTLNLSLMVLSALASFYFISIYFIVFLHEAILFAVNV